jgi:phosphate-selective porin OprO/OprP
MANKTCRNAAALLVGAALLFSAAGRAGAEDPDVKALLQRLEKVEKQNEELQKSVQAQQEQIRKQHQELERRADGADAPPAVGSDAVRKLVDGYLKEKDDKKKAEDAAKAAAAAASPQVATYEVGKDLAMKASWKDGFYAETADKAFTFHAGGRVDFDGAWYRNSRQLSQSVGAFNNFVDPNNGGVGSGLNDGAELRRARIRLDGTFYEVVDYVFETDLSNVIDERRRTLGVPTAAGAAPPPASVSGTPFEFEPNNGVRFTDVSMGIKDLPYVGEFRAGHQKEFLMFANATSSRFLPFIERPLIFDAFNDDYQYALGLTASSNFWGDRASYWVGAFRNTNPFTNDNRNGGFDAGDGSYVYDARLTALPVWLDDGDSWVHVGADYSYRNLHDDVTRFRTLPQVRSGAGFEIPSILNTGAIFSGDAQQNFTLEYASAFGPWTLTAEYSGSVVRNAFTGGLPLPNGRLPAGVAAHGDYFAQGYYVEVLYFLTGDHQTYDLNRRGYGRIRPRENFFLVDGERGPLFGHGAWQVGVRYDYIDLSNHGINGGFAHAITVGLNWYLNPNAKLQWNYVWTERNFAPDNNAGMVAGDINAFGMRFHWDF